LEEHLGAYLSRLKFEQGFAEETARGDLLEPAAITVLRRGTPCFLGTFTPYTPPPKAGG